MNWLRRVMMGRYGNDTLNNALLIGSVVLILLDRLTRLQLFWIVAFAMLVLCYLRMFSRNIARRYAENEKFLTIWNPLRARLMAALDGVRDCKTHRHYKCPSCGQKLRVPRGKGKISISCPKCGSGFIKNT